MSFRAFSKSFLAVALMGALLALHVRGGAVVPATFEDCAQFKSESPEAEDGVFVTESSQSMYCDMTTDGGGWTLLASFDGPSSSNRNYAPKYALYFNTENQWIQGNSDGIPVTDEVNGIDDFFVYSQDWRNFLTAGEQYELRQRVIVPATGIELDASWVFTYNGHVNQASAEDDLDRRSWLLDDTVVYTDTTGIAWERPADEYSRFWLPFTPATTGNLVSGCSGLQYSSDGCTKSSTTARRYGNAGIIGSEADGQDPAGSWAPHLNNAFDIVYVHQLNTAIGITGNAMALRYYIRPLRAADKFTAYALSEVRPEAEETCDRLILSNPSLSSGTYSLLKNEEFVSTYCHFYNDGGDMKAWTLMTDMVFGGTGSGKTYNDRNQYTNYFENALWINGVSDGLPEDSTTNDLSGFFVHSHDWNKHLKTGGIYRLKQSFGKPGGSNIGINGGSEVMEVSYEFVYNGFVEQGAVPSGQEAVNRGWRLTDRAVHQDSTGISWHTPVEVVRFYLPFTAASSSGSLYTGCNSYQFHSSGCSKTTAGTRRYGNAGIIGAATDNNDPAAAWAPHPRDSFDLVFIHQSPPTGYQTSGDPMVLQYWIQEL